LPPCSCLNYVGAPAKVALLHALQTEEACAAAAACKLFNLHQSHRSNCLTVSVSASYTACCLCLAAIIRLLGLSFCMYCSKKNQVQQLSCLCLIALERLPSLSLYTQCGRIKCSSCLAFVPLPWAACPADLFACTKAE